MKTTVKILRRYAQTSCSVSPVCSLIASDRSHYVPIQRCCVHWAVLIFTSNVTHRVVYVLGCINTVLFSSFFNVLNQFYNIVYRPYFVMEVIKMQCVIVGCGIPTTIIYFVEKRGSVFLVKSDDTPDILFGGTSIKN